MIQHIVFIQATDSQYEVLDSFRKDLMKAFERQGVKCEFFDLRGQKRAVWQQIKDSAPDCLFSFQYFKEESNFLSLPLVCFLVDSAIYYASFCEPDPYVILSNIDEDSCEVLREMGAGHVLHLPHGVDAHLSLVEGVRKYPVTMLGGLIDLEVEREKWQRKYSEDWIESMDKMIEEVLSNRERAFYEIFQREWEENGAGIDFNAAFKDCEIYYRSRSRLELVRSIHTAPIHIFGSGEEVWKKYCSDQKNVEVHGAIAYEKAIEIMQQTQILLNSSIQFKRGSHERIFYGLMCGCTVVTENVPFISSQFDAGEGIISFDYGEDINQKIQEELADEAERVERVKLGRKKVLEAHTWDRRATELLEKLPPILKSIQKYQTKQNWY